MSLTSTPLGLGVRRVFFFFLFFRERNMEAGINHGDISVTFLNRGFRSQDVSGLGYSG